MTPQERKARAIQMHARGVSCREIAAELGYSVSTVYTYVSDPDGSKIKARKERMRGICSDCGGPTTGTASGRSRQPRRCSLCERRDPSGKFWTREAVIDAIRDWNDRYGAPPTATDWNPARARSLGHHDRAERFQRGGCWPYVPTVQALFSSWADAIESAGFNRPKPGVYDRARARVERPENWSRVGAHKRVAA